MQKKSLILPLAAAALVISGGVTAITVAHADTTATAPGVANTTGKQWGTPPAAAGMVTAVNGTTITLTDMKSNTTYTVDASNATITKMAKPTTQGAKPVSTTITVSGIAVGDMLRVQGTVNGTTITATKIEDGMIGRGGGEFGRMPGVMGTVTAVNGSTLTVQGKDGKTYTVNASGATADKMQTISVSDIQIGDTVGVQGDTSGTSVMAKHIMDGMPNVKFGI